MNSKKNQTRNPKPRPWFVYALEDPRDGAVRYVGKAADPVERWRGHIKEARFKPSLNNHRLNWIRSLLASGVEPQMVLIESGVGDSWRERESFWIHTLKSCCSLTNSRNGGEGRSFVLMTDETRAKLRAARAGKKMSEESKQKLRSLYKDRPVGGGVRGGERSHEARRNMSQARKREWAGFDDAPRREKLAHLDALRQAQSAAVICVDTGAVFESRSAAARSAGVCAKSIRNSIQLGRRVNGKLYKDHKPDKES